MKKRVVAGTIIFSSIALVALIMIQLYWIVSAFEFRETNFNRAVDEVVLGVITKLEKMESAGNINKSISNNFGNIPSDKLLDTIQKLFLLELDSIPWESGELDSNMVISGANVRISIARDSGNKIVKRLEPIDKVRADTMFSSQHDLFLFGKHKDKNLNEQFDQLMIRLYRINDMFNDLFSIRPRESIENRVSIELIDELLREAFLNRSLTSDFQIGVYSTSRQQLVMEKNVADRNAFYANGKRYLLFPNDLFLSPNYLVIYFPYQKSFVIHQMTKMIVVSFLIMVIILLAFFFTIQTLFRQQKLSQMKNDFISNMTHEFKTPISTVSLACEVMKDPEINKGDDLYEEYIDIIAQENKRLGIMAEKILQTAVIEKGQLTHRSELVEMHSLIEEIVNVNLMHVEIKDGEIDLQLKATETQVRGDKHHLLNMLNNLLDNANKYSPKKPKITVRTFNANHRLVIQILDKGIGISKSNQKRIFEKLYRVHTGDLHDVKGFGLGLSYVKFIVEKHKGSIEVDSELNKGSCFTIKLPLI